MDEVPACMRAAVAVAAEEGWDGYGARPISIAASEQAQRFLEALPTWPPAPDVSVDPDGEIALDWFGERSILSISIGSGGELSYAGAFGVNRVSGVEYFIDTIPDAIVEHIRRLVRSVS